MSHTNGKLTERQSQVLDMLKQDMTTSEIANALGITTKASTDICVACVSMAICPTRRASLEPASPSR